MVLPPSSLSTINNLDSNTLRLRRSHANETISDHFHIPLPDYVVQLERKATEYSCARKEDLSVRKTGKMLRLEVYRKKEIINNLLLAQAISRPS